MMHLFVQAAATRSLARGTNYNAIISMLKEVGPLYNVMPLSSSDQDTMIASVTFL